LPFMLRSAEGRYRGRTWVEVHSTSERGPKMRTLIVALVAIAALTGTVVEANAVVCAKGVYHAGCAGPHGAVVAPRGAAVVRPYARPVVAAPVCRWVNGVRVCR
jgi:hypothetical protein